MPDPRTDGIIKGKDLKLYKKLAAEKKKLEGLLAAGKKQDPFWFYVPSDGTISDAGRRLFEKYLEPDDIPHGDLECQLDAHLSEAGIICIFGGNQSGKTTACCIEAFIWATGQVPISLRGVYPESKLPTEFPQHIRVEGVDHKTFLANLLPTYRYWAPRDYLINKDFGTSYSAEQRVITLVFPKSRDLMGTIEFMTNQQSVDSHQGPARHGVIYDEEPRHDIYKENLMRFVTAKKLKIMFGMTPTHGMSWMHEDIVLRSEDGGGNNIECFKVPTLTNKLANLEIVEEIIQEQGDYNSKKMRLLGEFVSLSGLVYGATFNKKIHVIEPFDLDYDNYIVYRGLDPHLVKPTYCVELAVDREENEYVVGTYARDRDTEVIKEDLAGRARSRNYRLGWSICDKSADSSIRVLGDRNVYRELSRGKNAIPALFTSDKYTGSIHAGVDTIKKLLKVNEDTGKPKLFIFNIPENKDLITAMRTMERDRAQNEEKSGKRDKIAEGKHDAHACLRYLHQRKIRWYPPMESVPEYKPVNEAVNY